jgi:hypothetical protein
MEEISYRLDDDINTKFFSAIEKELGFKSPHKIIKLVRLVVGHLFYKNSDQPKPDEAPDPVALHFTCYTNELPATGTAAIQHLDELVDTIYLEDQQKDDRFFTHEVHALSAVITVLKYMNKFFAFFRRYHFPYLLVNEYKQAVQEEAAYNFLPIND